MVGIVVPFGMAYFQVLCQFQGVYLDDDDDDDYYYYQ